jgi:hypothetical protein
MPVVVGELHDPVSARTAEAMACCSVTSAKRWASVLERLRSGSSLGRSAWVSSGGGKLRAHCDGKVLLASLLTCGTEEAAEIMVTRGMVPEGLHDPSSSMRGWPCAECETRFSEAKIAAIGAVDLMGVASDKSASWCGSCGEFWGVRGPGMTTTPKSMVPLLAAASLGQASMLRAELAVAEAFGAETEVEWRTVSRQTALDFIENHRLFDQTGLGHAPGNQYVAAFCCAWSGSMWTPACPFKSFPRMASGEVASVWPSMVALAEIGVVLCRVRLASGPTRVSLALPWL